MTSAAGRPHAEKHPETHPAHGPGQQRGEDGIADDRILEQLEDGDSHAGQDRHVQRPEREPEGQRLPAPQQQDGVADAEHPCRGYPPRIIADQGEPEHAAARELIRHRQRDDRETRQQRADGGGQQGMPLPPQRQVRTPQHVPIQKAHSRIP